MYVRANSLMPLQLRIVGIVDANGPASKCLFSLVCDCQKMQHIVMTNSEYFSENGKEKCFRGRNSDTKRPIWDVCRNELGKLKFHAILFDILN
jgi:hypothetical protein